MVNLEKCVVYFLLLLILNSGVWFGNHVTTDADSFFHLFTNFKREKRRREGEKEEGKEERLLLYATSACFVAWKAMKKKEKK